MFYHSTHKQSAKVSLNEAIHNALAPDYGLYMPESIRFFPSAFYKNLAGMSLQEMAFIVAESFWGEDIPAASLQEIVYETFKFDIPLAKIDKDCYVLELFHGPTLSYKDIGIRFMANLLNFFNRQAKSKPVNILVATMGNTGAAVANSFWGIPEVNAYILYPHGKVSPIQEKLLAASGENITAIAVDGTFEDCQTIVNQALIDHDLNSKMSFTTAGSLNIVCLLSQTIYFFYAYSQLLRETEKPGKVVFCMPNGDSGNLVAGIVAKRMGLPVNRFITTLLQDKTPTKSPVSFSLPLHPALSASRHDMPDNSERIKMLYDNANDAIGREIDYVGYSNADLCKILQDSCRKGTYTFSPCGALCYQALGDRLCSDEIGILLETTHPAKFGNALSEAIGKEVAAPTSLRPFIHSKNKSLHMPPLFADFKNFLLQKS